MTEETPATPGKARTKRRTPRCPICGRAQDPAFRPFCSSRCKSIDLGRWFGETYRFPTAERSPDSDGES